MPSLLNPINVTWINVLTSVPLALIAGLFIAVIYRRVMTNLSYSVPIQHTVVYLSMIVALIMIIVANELVRAFTLLGAFAVIRFRTPIKDARDGAFIFWSLAAGMGAGVGLYVETTLGVGLIGLFIWLMHLSRFGLTSGREILVTLTVPQTGAGDAPVYAPVFERHLAGHDLINVRSVLGGQRLELTFYVRPRPDTDLVRCSPAGTTQRGPRRPPSRCRSARAPWCGPVSCRAPDRQRRHSQTRCHNVGSAERSCRGRRPPVAARTRRRRAARTTRRAQ